MLAVEAHVFQFPFLFVLDFCTVNASALLELENADVADCYLTEM